MYLWKTFRACSVNMQFMISYYEMIDSIEMHSHACLIHEST